MKPLSIKTTRTKLICFAYQLRNACFFMTKCIAVIIIVCITILAAATSYLLCAPLLLYNYFKTNQENKSIFYGNNSQ